MTAAEHAAAGGRRPTRARRLSKEPRLSDGVVALDAFTADDVDTHLAGEDDEHARRFGWYPARSTEETVRSAFACWQDDWRCQGPTRAFAARDATGGELIGGCELRLADNGLATMSYWIFPRHRRRGLGSRVVRIACEYAFFELGVGRIELTIDADNAGSIGVARRAGFEMDPERRPGKVLYVRMRRHPASNA